MKSYLYIKIWVEVCDPDLQFYSLIFQSGLGLGALGWLNDFLPPPPAPPTSCHYHSSWFKDFYVASWEKLQLADYIIPRQVILQRKGP